MDMIKQKQYRVPSVEEQLAELKRKVEFHDVLIKEHLKKHERDAE